MTRVNARRDKAGFRRFYAYLRETGLEEPLRAACAAHRATLADAYGDAKGPTAHAARLECWALLALEHGKSPAEIGRMFDRDGGSVRYGLRRMAEEAAARGAALALDTARPAARFVAEAAAEAVRANGQARAARQNGAGVIINGEGEEDR